MQPKNQLEMFRHLMSGGKFVNKCKQYLVFNDNGMLCITYSNGNIQRHNSPVKNINPQSWYYV
jgi:hypothetical protein